MRTLQLASGGGDAPGGKSKASDVSVKSWNEWPGQSEGEPLDLDHFWNVMKTYFPERQGTKWLESIVASLQVAVGLCDSPRWGPGGALRPLPVLGDFSHDVIAEHTPALEAVYEQLGGDKERDKVFDIDRRIATLDVLLDSLVKLGYKPDRAQKPDESSADRDRLDDIIINDDEFLSMQRAEPSAPTMSGDGVPTISAVLDGEVRHAAIFKVSAPAQVENDDARARAQRKYVIGGSATPVPSTDVSSSRTATVELVGYEAVPSTAQVLLADKVILAREEDDIITRMLRTDEFALQQAANVLGSRMDSLLQTKLRPALKVVAQDARQWAATEKTYLRQQAWKSIASAIARGTKDQVPDFNKALPPAALPASWVIQVQGRPSKEQVAEKKAAAGDDQDDAVCMVCFDGASADNNSILFCDGCNASMHQACYGTKEVPEGDFFCDRCMAVQLLVDSSDTLEVDLQTRETRTAFTCCLCPLYHGALKRCTDGRWAHLCCSIWSENAVITDMGDMGPIDLSQVDVRSEIVANPDPKRYTGDKRRAVPGTPQEPSHDDGKVCFVCKLGYGYLRTCCGGDGKDECEKVFHPLCAWFAGCHVESSVLDPTFQGNMRKGVYPSGIRVDFCCDVHSGVVPLEIEPESVPVPTTVPASPAPVSVPAPAPAPAPEAPGGVEAYVPCASSEATTDTVDAVISLSPTCAAAVAVVAAAKKKTKKEKVPMCPLDLQQKIRAKYRIRVTDLDGIPNQFKRRRKAPSAKSGGAAGRSGRSGDMQQKPLSPDAYDHSICGVCIRGAPPEGFMPNHLLGPVEHLSMVCCSSCSVHCHRHCLEELGVPLSPPPIEERVIDATTDVPGGDTAMLVGSCVGVEADVGVKQEGSLPSPSPSPAPIDLTASSRRPSLVVPRPWSLSLFPWPRLARPRRVLGGVRAYTCGSCRFPVPAPADDEDGDEEPPGCELCPRIGGMLLPTQDGYFAHPYCVRNSPKGVARFTADGRVELRPLPKESKKAKCGVCNRKGGSTLLCCEQECTVRAHPPVRGAEWSGVRVQPQRHL